MKLIKSLVIKKKQDYVVWDVDISNCDLNTSVTVENGVLGYYTKNGILECTFVAGRPGLIKPKAEKKLNSKYQLIGALADPFKIVLGVGELPYHDDEINYETMVGSCCTMNVIANDPWKLKTNMSQEDISEDDVISFVRGKLSEVYKTLLSQLVKDREYTEIQTMLTKLSEALKAKFSEGLKPFGLFIDSLCVDKITFPTEYLDARKDYFANVNLKKELKDQDRRDANKLREMGEFIKNSKATQPASENNNDYYCKKCGTKLDKDENYCHKCGERRD